MSFMGFWLVTAVIWFTFTILNFLVHILILFVISSNFLMFTLVSSWKLLPYYSNAISLYWSLTFSPFSGILTQSILKSYKIKPTIRHSSLLPLFCPYFPLIGLYYTYFLRGKKKKWWSQFLKVDWFLRLSFLIIYSIQHS